MGEFHTICYLLSTIEKRFQDAGLRDLIAEGSITALMEGRKYNRAVRLHKIVYVAMMRLAWNGFLLWIHASHGAEVRHLEETLKSISTFHDEVSQTTFTVLMDDASCTRMPILFQEYRHREWQPIDSFLDVLPWHGWEYAWLAACSKIERLAAPSRINLRHNSMVLRLWQGELCTFPVILLCHNVTPSHWPPRDAPTVHAMWFQCPAW